MDIVIVGLGGIGGWLVQPVYIMLTALPQSNLLVLMDGDRFEEGNAARQPLAMSISGTATRSP